MSNNPIEKQPSCKKICSFQEGYCEKDVDGGQEMAVMIG